MDYKSVQFAIAIYGFFILFSVRGKNPAFVKWSAGGKEKACHTSW